MAEKLSIKDYNRNMIITLVLSVLGIVLIFASQYFGNSIIIMAIGIFICIYAFIRAQMNMRKYRASQWLRYDEVKKKNEEIYNRISKSRKQ